jgi:Na+/H+-dicarboxylate symporter
MMVMMPDTPVSTPESRWARWMRDNRLAASITLGVSIGLVWGITTGVGFAVLVGDGVIGTWEVFVPGGIVIGSVVGVAIYKGARSVTRSGSRAR